ncbi:MAG: hypothetical protein HKO65_16335, partial [Gemmatimonadetes bacterium]|nr:hypothetical protein [Gemmatimonadota bacterium]
MRPTFHVLDDELITQIVDEARSLLTTLGVTIHNPDLLSVFSDHGAEVDRSSDHVRYTDELIDQALSTAPSSFKLYDVLGNQTHDFSGDNVHFVPGSAAINIHDNATGEIRRPTTADYVRYAKLMGSMDNIAAQSTAFIPADVADSIADSYRLFLSLLFCEKPVVTGAFSAGGFGLIRDLQIIVRGGAEALRDRPL